MGGLGQLRLITRRRGFAGVGSYLESSVAALRSIQAAPALRGYVAVVALLDLAQYTSGMAIWLYVFARGGTEAIALLVVTGSGTLALLAAPMSSLADRYGRGRIAAVGAVLRALVLLAIATSVAAHWPVWTTLALAGMEGAVYAIGAPALRALAPTLVQSASELTSVNLMISLGLALAIFLGPLVGGLAYQVTGAAPVVVGVATVFALSYFPLARFKRGVPPGESLPETHARHERIARTLAGLRSAASDSRIRLTLLVFCGYSFAAGILDVVLIVIARDVLHQSSSGVGALYGAFGIGGLFAGVGIGQLMRARLARIFGIAVVLWALPLGAIALVARPAAAWACGVVAGTAGTIAQAAGDTVLQRATPDPLMSRVLGVYEALTGIAYMAAALVPAILVTWLGPRTILVAGVAVAPLVVICCWRGLLRLDRDLDFHEERLKLVVRVPWLRATSLAEQDRVAALLEEEIVPPGDVIVYQGEVGTRFYILRSGAVRVLVDGHEVSRLGSGEWFGEVALLRDIPRTATVQATEDTALLSLSDDDFHRALEGVGTVARGESSRILGLNSLSGPGDLVWPARAIGRSTTTGAGAAVERSADRIAMLRHVPLLSYLPASALARIDAASSIERHAPGDTIRCEGDPPGPAYIIWQGRVKILCGDRPRRVTGPGDVIGDLATLHGRPRSATAVADDETVVLTLPRDELLAELTPGSPLAGV
ncbi:MAG: MFS transporter [Solirubrobacterales bacterium]|nr:MFS transporter [Solirubrobacterales bacterium]